MNTTIIISEINSPNNEFPMKICAQTDKLIFEDKYSGKRHTSTLLHIDINDNFLVLKGKKYKINRISNQMTIL